MGHVPNKLQIYNPKSVLIIKMLQSLGFTIKVSLAIAMFL